MPDSDHNIIKPVDGLQNIAGLTPARRREERKRKRKFHKEENQESEQKPRESVDENAPSNTPPEDDSDQASIDYCA